MTIFKLVLTVLFFPVLWACSIAFYDHIGAFQGAYGEFFLWGVFGFLLLFLFFYPFWRVYEFGQKIISGFFRFISPLNSFVSKVVPFYLTVILLSFYVTADWLGIDDYNHYFVFFAGFSFAMHVLLTAQDLQEQERSFIKPAYLSTMIVAFTLTVFITVLLFDLVFKEFTFPDFFAVVVTEAWDIYARVGEIVMGR